ncbi:mitochondrial inner membrane protease subunit 1-like [Tropilaelaps mercedesae]|uniref:Mitochondrial inner membrane protease subunit n=1 Tax=Tropilaelaps mercedesae TaxID=418985 RepID=A0A1V9X0W4_9ACAR|nr:mitochondrial inner membrane protease subunit 1-like [Tropilaelaps mercedesae]
MFSSKAVLASKNRLVYNAFEILRGAALCYCVFLYGIEVRYCTGPSMEPTIQNEDIIVVEKITRHLDSFRRGDIVVCISPTDPKSAQCKRILGLPGDILEGPGYGYQVVPQGSVWLQGDNFEDSTDSRSYGAVPKGLIVGRAFFKLNKWTWLQ